MFHTILMSDFDSCIGQSKCSENLISEIYNEFEVEEEVIGLEYKGQNYLISEGEYKSDLIIDPYTFVDTTRYFSYINKQGEWDWLEELDEILTELNEEEKNYL